MLSRIPPKAIRLQRLYSQSAPAVNFSRVGRTRAGHVTLASGTAAVTAAALLWYSASKTVHNDASASELIGKAREDLTIGLDDGTLYGVVWGSNR